VPLLKVVVPFVTLSTSAPISKVLPVVVTERGPVLGHIAALSGTAFAEPSTVKPAPLNSATTIWPCIPLLLIVSVPLDLRRAPYSVRLEA